MKLRVGRPTNICIGQYWPGFLPVYIGSKCTNGKVASDWLVSTSHTSYYRQTNRQHGLVKVTLNDLRNYRWTVGWILPLAMSPISWLITTWWLDTKNQSQRPIYSIGEKIKLLVYNLVLAMAAIHTTNTSLTLPPCERTPLNLQRRISKCCTFCTPIDLHSVQIGSNWRFIPCLRVVLCHLTWAGFEPTTFGMEVRRPNHRATMSPRRADRDKKQTGWL